MPFPVHLVSRVGDASSAAFEQDPTIQDEVNSALYSKGYRGLAALTAFQKDHGLRPTGQFDPETLDALGVVIR